MPLARYGVLVGTIIDHYRDKPDNQGRWFHVNVIVRAGRGRYHCAIDVDSKQSNTGVEWRTLTLGHADLGKVAKLPRGYHDLGHNKHSGALDYVRHKKLRLTGAPNQFWTQGSNVDAANALDPLLRIGARLWVYGEPFDTGYGMHNVHQNQGDPPGQWWNENGVWQDGATLIEQPDSSIIAFLNKFTSQSYQTDAQGHRL